MLFNSQIYVDGFSTAHRLDWSRNKGGITSYVEEDITSKILTKHKFPDDIDDPVFK